VEITHCCHAQAMSIALHKKSYESYSVSQSMLDEIAVFASAPDAYGRLARCVRVRCSARVPMAPAQLTGARDLRPRVREEGAAAADGGRRHDNAGRRHGDACCVRASLSLTCLVVDRKYVVTSTFV
jgi:hypothetical protein